MTNPTNWPDPERPGVPMFPERDGWHWLSNGPNEAPFPAEWSHEDYSDAEAEWFWDVGEELVSSHEMRGLYYRGPCPFPSAVNEAGCIALNNIVTLTEQARKNIAVASGARKMAKTVFPILRDIDNQVNAIRNSGLILTPTQIAEMLAEERERCIAAIEREKPSEDEACRSQFLNGKYHAISRAAGEIRNLGDAP